MDVKNNTCTHIFPDNKELNSLTRLAIEKAYAEGRDDTQLLNDIELVRHEPAFTNEQMEGFADDELNNIPAERFYIDHTNELLECLRVYLFDNDFSKLNDLLKFDNVGFNN